jgi:hypothetical protein
MEDWNEYVRKSENRLREIRNNLANAQNDEQRKMYKAQEAYEYDLLLNAKDLARG